MKSTLRFYRCSYHLSSLQHVRILRERELAPYPSQHSTTYWKRVRTIISMLANVETETAIYEPQEEITGSIEKCSSCEETIPEGSKNVIKCDGNCKRSYAKCMQLTASDLQTKRRPARVVQTMLH